MSGYAFARFTEYSPLPHPSSKTNGLLFLKKFLRQLPLSSNESLSTSSRDGCTTFEKVSFSLKRLSLFLLPKILIFGKIKEIYYRSNYCYLCFYAEKENNNGSTIALGIGPCYALHTYNSSFT